MTAIQATPSVDRKQEAATSAVLPEAQAVRLCDGTSALLRPTVPADLQRVKALFDRATHESLCLRFFTPRRSVDPRLLELMTQTDGVERLNLVVTLGEGEVEQVLGVAGYVRVPRRDTAEIAFMVDDAYQGKGIGTLLLERLALYAGEHGITRLVADVMGENRKMLDVFHRSDFKLHETDEHGTVHLELPTKADAEVVTR